MSTLYAWTNSTYNLTYYTTDETASDGKLYKADGTEIKEILFGDDYVGYTPCTYYSSSNQISIYGHI